MYNRISRLYMIVRFKPISYSTLVKYQFDIGMYTKLQNVNNLLRTLTEKLIPCLVCPAAVQ